MSAQGPPPARAVAAAALAALLLTAFAFAFYRAARVADTPPKDRTDDAKRAAGKQEDKAPRQPQQSDAGPAAAVPAGSASEESERKDTPASAGDPAALYVSESALGSQAFKAGSFAAAETHFSRALELIPNDETAGRMILLNNRAAVREKLGDLQGLIEDTSLALSVDRTYRRALSRRARAYEALGQLHTSLEDYCLISVIDGATKPDEFVDAAIQRLIQTIGKAEAEELWKRRAQGTKLANLPKPGFCRTFYYTFSREQKCFRAEGSPSQLELKDLLDELSQQASNENKGALHFKIGTLLKKMLEFERAATHFEEASKMASKPLRALALEELGTLYLLSGDTKSAKEALGQALALSETSSTLIKLAGMAIEDGDVMHGKELLERAEIVAGNSPELLGDVHFHKSQMYLVDQDLDQARAALERALELVPDFGLAHMQLGVVQFRLEDAEAALRSLERACEVVPELPEVHNYHGEVLMTVRKITEAEKKFADAAAADSTCALPLLNRGVMYMSAPDGGPVGQAELANAGALFDQAVKVDPTCELAYAHRASYFFHLSDYNAAMAEYSLAVHHAKTKLDAGEYLGLKAFCQARAHAHRVLEGDA